MGAKGGVKDLSGQRLAGAEVIRRVENSPEGNAVWECCLACGHIQNVEGIRLRADERLGRTLRCKVCRDDDRERARLLVDLRRLDRAIEVLYGERDQAEALGLDPSPILARIEELEHQAAEIIGQRHEIRMKPMREAMKTIRQALELLGK